LRKHFKCVYLGLALFYLSGCSATVRHTMSKPNLKLRNFNKVILYLMNNSGSVSFSSANLKNVRSMQIMDGEKQGIIALESLQFEMMSIGFDIVTSESDAKAIVEFFIGQIRYDPVGGWIADQAIVKFRERTTGDIIAIFQAKKQMITPSINNIVSNLVKEIGKSF